MQFAPEPLPAPRAFFAASAIGSEIPRPASAPTCKKLRRLTRSQSREIPVVNESTARLLSTGIFGGFFEAGTRPFANPRARISRATLMLPHRPTERQLKIRTRGFYSDFRGG